MAKLKVGTRFEGTQVRGMMLHPVEARADVRGLGDSIADSQSWFTYYYWNNNDNAPDFARTVEIHRKPGYDPVELFVDPGISSPKLAIGKRLLMRKLGFRTLMDVIPLDASLVRGSHGRLTDKTEDGPLVISSEPLGKTKLAATDVKPLLLDLIFPS